MLGRHVTDVHDVELQVVVLLHVIFDYVLQELVAVVLGELAGQVVPGLHEDHHVGQEGVLQELEEVLGDLEVDLLLVLFEVQVQGLQ